MIVPITVENPSRQISQKTNGYTRPSMALLLNGLLPESFFAGAETFFDTSKARSRRFQNSPSGLKQLESLFFHFAKNYEEKMFQ
jgi:hypothetical protein